MIEEDAVSQLNRQGVTLMGKPMGIYSFVGTVHGLSVLIDGLPLPDTNGLIGCRVCGLCDRSCDNCSRCGTDVPDEYNRK